MKPEIYETLCAVWYHLQNLKCVKKTHFMTRFFKLYKWYQMAQSNRYVLQTYSASLKQCSAGLSLYLLLTKAHEFTNKISL